MRDLKMYLGQEKKSRKVKVKVFAYGFVAGFFVYVCVLYIQYIHSRDSKIIEHYSQCAAYNEAINKLNQKLSNVRNLTIDERDKLFFEYNHLMQLYTSNCDITSIED